MTTEHALHIINRVYVDTYIECRSINTLRSNRFKHFCLTLLQINRIQINQATYCNNRIRWFDILIFRNPSIQKQKDPYVTLLLVMNKLELFAPIIVIRHTHLGGNKRSIKIWVIPSNTKDPLDNRSVWWSIHDWSNIMTAFESEADGPRMKVRN